MPDYRYVLYDTAIFGVTALAESTLFGVVQGGDATHIESFTNMRGGGSLPNEEKLVVDKLSAVIDSSVPLADIQNVWYGSFLEIRISDKSVFKAPLQICADASFWGGHFTQTAAANLVGLGLFGDGYELDPKITIPGGTSFRVRVVQGLALSAAGLKIKILMHGLYTIP